MESREAGSPEPRRYWLRWLRWPGTLACLAVTVAWVDFDAVVRQLAQAQPMPLLVALGLSVPVVVLMAARWSFTARRMGLRLSFRLACREYYVSQLFNRVLPGGVVGDVGRAVRVAARQPGQGAAMVRSVVLDRVSGQVALWLTVGAGAVVWGVDGKEPVLLAVGAVAGVVAAGGWATARLPCLRASGPGRAVRQLGRELSAAFLHRGAWALQLGLSFAIVGLLGVTFAACAVAVGASMTMAELVLIAPTLLAVASVPLTVGGWGLREAASAGLFGLAGLSPDDGVAAAVAFGTLNLVAALPGAILLLVPPAASPSAKEASR